jgi:hypothetical protein
MGDSLRDALGSLEQAVAGALETVTMIGTPADIEKVVGLLIQKKIVTEMLIEKMNRLDDFTQPEPSRTPNLWDQLMNTVHNGTN